MKIAVITCYDQNDYVRARTLRAAFAAVPGAEIKIIRNSRRGFLRYIEVPLKILAARLFNSIDVYVITFRGYEILPFTLLVKGRQPLVFDELVNAVEFLQEHNRINMKNLLARWFVWWYSRLLKRCRFVLADTISHAEHSAQLGHLPVSHFRVIPMAADETLFYPRTAKSYVHQKLFTVFYYGNAMRPLQGLEYIIEAAVLLRDQPGIVFQIIGGHAEAAKACAQAVAQGAAIDYQPWVPFEDFPERIHQADLTLGGPFGKTLQSQFVVPGKTTQFMACAKSVVVARNLAHQGFVDKKNCLIIPPADAKALAEAIAWSAKHRTLLNKIGLAGRQLYEKQFSQIVVNQAVAQLVQELT